jgi:hypothetical protein
LRHALDPFKEKGRQLRLKAPSFRRRGDIGITQYLTIMETNSQRANKKTTHLMALQERWDNLFAFIHSPTVFNRLYEHFRDNREFTDVVLLSLETALVVDFKEQFNDGFLFGETRSAYCSKTEEAVHLGHMSDYLVERVEFKRSRKLYQYVVGLRERSPRLNQFIVRWEQLYESSFAIPDFRNVVHEARVVLTELFRSGRVTTIATGKNNQLLLYWKLVSENDVQMTSHYRQSGNQMSCKYYVLEENETYEDLIKDDKLKRDLADHPRLKSLVKAYFPFIKIESKLCDLHSHLQNLYKTYVDADVEVSDFKKVDCESWELEMHKKRLNYHKSRFRKHLTKFKIIVDEIKKANFFEMIKLSVILDQLDICDVPLSEVQAERGAFKILLGCENNFVYRDMQDLFSDSKNIMN